MVSSLLDRFHGRHRRERARDVRVRHRSLWALAAFLYPLWWLFFAAVLESARGPLYENLAISALFGLCIVASAFSPWASQNIRVLHGFLAAVMTAHFFSVAARTGVTYGQGIALFVIVSAITSTFVTWRAILTYSAFTLALGAVLWVQTHEIDGATLFLGLVTLFGVNYVASYDRIGMIHSLRIREKELEYANAKTNEILESINEGFFTLDRNYSVVYANPVAKRMVGITNEAYLNQKLWEILPGAYGSPFHNAYERALNGETVEFQGQFEPSGEWFEVRTYPNKLGISVFIRDITERKKMELAIEEQKLKTVVAARLSNLGEMAGGIAHEINNPLSIIRLKAQQLQEMVEDEERGRKFTPEGVLNTARKIEETTTRISRIIKSLRALTRDADDEPFVDASLNSILDDTLEICRERFRNNSIELVVENSPEHVHLRCRPIQISQVLLNLLGNAFDGVVHLEERWVKLNFEDSDDTVMISVTDSGTGIAPEIQLKLFQPFFTTKEVGKGTGLGLSISKRIVESHYGQLEYDPECSNTRFVIHLPKRVEISPAQAA